MRDRAARIEPAPVRAGKARKQAGGAAKTEIAPGAGPPSKQEERPKPSDYSCAVPRAYSIARLSDALSLSKTTIYRLIAEGELHPIRVGSRVLIVASEVDEWLAKKLAEAIG
jgi:excisionase family DNA binding protein